MQRHHAGICAVLGDVPERAGLPEHHRQSRRHDQRVRVLQPVHPQVSPTFSDTTNGQKFTRTRACPAGATCRRNSAEAISEAPFDATTSSVLPLADFGTASFTNASITNTTGTHRGGLQSSFWNTYRITQAAGSGTNFTITGDAIPEGTVLDTPSPLSQKVSFTDQWATANG